MHLLTVNAKYESFWADPQSVPIIWIGLLFGILCLTTYFEIMTQQLTPTSKVLALRNPQDVIKMFRERTAQCLILSNYTQPQAYTVETLFLYFITYRKSAIEKYSH